MSSFVKHRLCKEGACMEVEHWQAKRCEGDFCAYADEELADDRPIFEQRDTDEEARLDRRARARECK